MEELQKVFKEKGEKQMSFETDFKKACVSKIGVSADYDIKLLGFRVAKGNFHKVVELKPLTTVEELARVFWNNGGKQHYTLVEELKKDWEKDRVKFEKTFAIYTESSKANFKSYVNLFVNEKNKQTYEWCVVCLKTAVFSDKKIEKWMSENK